MADDFHRLKAQKDAIVRKQYPQRALTRIYDILAGINDHVELGDDGYARFGSTSDADRLSDLVRELEPAALADHGSDKGSEG